MSGRGPFGALVRLEAVRTFRAMRWPFLLAVGLTIAVIVVGGDVGDTLVMITIGAFVLIVGPGALVMRDKLERTVVLLQRLPVSASVVVAAKFVAVALALLAVTGLATLVAAEVLALGPVSAVGFLLLCWLPLTLMNWLLVGIVLRLDPENFVWVVAIVFGVIVGGGHLWEWLDAGEFVRRAWQTGTLPLALAISFLVTLLTLAGIAFWLASNGIRRYDPGRAEANY